MPQRPVKTQKQLLAENDGLRARLAHAEDALRAIRGGEVDSLFVTGVGGEQLFTLKGADRSYRVLIEEMNEGALTLTAEGVILYANRRLAEMLKAPLEKVIGSALHTWMAPDSQQILQSLLQKGGDNHRREELALIASDGTQVPVYLSVTSLLLNETPVSFGLVATDLTEHKRSEAIAASEKFARELLAAANEGRLALLSVIEDQKRTEAALAASESELRALFASMHDGVLVIDREGVYRKIAPTNSDVLYLTPQELLGKRLQDVFPAEQAERFYGVIQQVLDTQRSTQIEYQLTIGGQSVWYETTVSAMNADNSLWVARDITGRKQAAAQLSDALIFNQTIIGAAPIGIATYDASGAATSANEALARIIGASVEQVQSQNFREIESWKKSGLLAAAEEALASGDTQALDVNVTSTFGKEVWLNSRFAPFRFHGERHLLGLFADITERQQAEAAERDQRGLAEALRDTAAALSSTLEFNEVLERVLASVGGVVPHDTADIMLVEDGVARVAGTRGYGTRPNLPDITGIRLQISETANLRRMVETGQPAAIADTWADPEWVKYPESRWIRSYVGAPIIAKGTLVGFLNLDSATPGFFNLAHAARLQAFADQAATALENARLLEQTRQRLAELEALHKVSSALRTAQTREEALPILLDETLAALETDAGAVWLYHADSGELRVAVARGWHAKTGIAPAKSGEGIGGLVFEAGKTHNSTDLRADPLTRAPARELIPSGWAGACVPIRSGAGTIGVLLVSVPFPRQVAPQQVTLLESLAEMAGAAVHRMYLHEQTEQRLRQVVALHAIDMAISASLDLKIVLNVLLEKVSSELEVDATDILLLHPQRRVLEYAAGRGFRTQAFQAARLRLGEGYAGRAALERRSSFIPQLADQNDNPRLAKHLAAEGFSAYYGVPLIAKGQVVGVLEVFQRSSLPSDAEWVAFLETLAGQAAVAIENAQLFDGLQRSNIDLAMAYDATIEGWSHALDLRDKETEGHTVRTTELTERLARAMGLRDEELVHVRRGGLLHDIGKMGVPDGVLLKPGPLTEDEWVLMRKHPDFAYEMLAPIAYLKPALDIPYCHHEKWDGSGYPRGLKGEQIPLAARLFAVVDVWDALRSDRPYRPAWPEEKVIEHIQAGSGSHFDPAVVDLFLNLDKPPAPGAAG